MEIQYKTEIQYKI